VLAIKIGFYRRGVVIGDLFLYANALTNTHLPGQLLYLADYQLMRGSTTLVLDHFEPSTVLLIPLFWLFETPLVLVVLQALAPVVLAGCLVVLARRLAGAAWLGWAVAVLTLYNPQFLTAVIDGVFGFHHDAQYLIYAPLFITCFLLRRFCWAALFLALFLGVKEDAAFFGIVFGLAAAVLRERRLTPTQPTPIEGEGSTRPSRPLDGGGPGWGWSYGHGYRRWGLIVAAVSAAWFVATVLALPHLIASPNIYATRGGAELQQGLAHLVAVSWDNFFARKWHVLWLYFFYAFGSPAFVAAGIPDIAMFSIMKQDANHYFDFTIVTFLAFGVLMALTRLRVAPVGTLAGRFRPVITAAFALQVVLCVPFGLLELRHQWARGVAEAPPVAAADAEAAWRMVDPACSVTVSAALLPQFYRVHYWFQWENAGNARFIVTGNPPNRGQDDQVADFAATHAAQLDPVGRSGPVTVWRNRDAPCLPW
jgi:hypothetical protein